MFRYFNWMSLIHFTLESISTKNPKIFRQNRRERSKLHTTDAVRYIYVNVQFVCKVGIARVMCCSRRYCRRSRNRFVVAPRGGGSCFGGVASTSKGGCSRILCTWCVCARTTTSTEPSGSTKVYEEALLWADIWICGWMMYTNIYTNYGGWIAGEALN